MSYVYAMPNPPNRPGRPGQPGSSGQPGAAGTESVEWLSPKQVRSIFKAAGLPSSESTLDRLARAERITYRRSPWSRYRQYLGAEVRALAAAMQATEVHAIPETLATQQDRAIAEGLDGAAA